MKIFKKLRTKSIKYVFRGMTLLLRTAHSIIKYIAAGTVAFAALFGVIIFE